MKRNFQISMFVKFYYLEIEDDVYEMNFGRSIRY